MAVAEEEEEQQRSNSNQIGNQIVIVILLTGGTFTTAAGNQVKHQVVYNLLFNNRLFSYSDQKKNFSSLFFLCLPEKTRQRFRESAIGRKGKRSWITWESD